MTAPRAPLVLAVRALSLSALLAPSALAKAAAPEEASVTIEKRRGHFFTNVTINGIEAGQFLVDTGATSVSIPSSMARECHVDGPFQKVIMQTATSRVVGYRGKAAITVGPFALTDVDVVVTPGGQPLLGMSFLSQLDMRATPTTLQLRSVAGMERIDIADIDAARVQLAAVELPSQMGDARCSYDVAGDRWRCDERIFAELDGATATGATSGMKVKIDLLRSEGCLSGVHMRVSADDNKSLVVPWNQSVVVADGVTRPSPRASIGRAEQGSEVAYVLSLADRCIDDDGSDHTSAHEVSWSVPVLVGNAPARVKWLHRWTPATASERTLLEAMTPPAAPPDSRADEAAPSGTFPLWTSLGGAASLLVAGASGGVAAALAGPQLDAALIAGAVGLAVSAPLLVGGGYLIDASVPVQDEATLKLRADEDLQRKKHAAYQRQISPH